MHRNVTAVYRTREVADLVQRGLKDIGIPAHDIHVIPDPAHDTAAGRSGATATGGTTSGMGAGAAPRGTAAGAGDTTGMGTTGAGAAVPQHPVGGHDHALRDAGYLEAGRDDPAHTDRLHDLHLPEDDVRTYQHCIRQGDYVVSAEVDESKLDKVKAIMRRPEAEVHDIEHRSSEFRDADLVPHSKGRAHATDRPWSAKALPGDDRYARTYSREKPLRDSSV